MYVCMYVYIYIYIYIYRFWQYGQVPSPAVKWNQHLHKACQQKEAWSALKCPGRWLRWLWTSENTVDQHQQMTWQPKPSLTVETSHWTSSNMDSVPLHSSSRLWDLDFQMKCKIYFHLKRRLWTTEQQTVQFFFSLAQVKCFWWCFCFRSGLVALFLKMSERGDSWYTDSSSLTSVHSLWSSPKCLNQLCLTVFSSLRSSLLLVHIFLPNFFLPVNFAFNMLWYSTLWTVTSFSIDPLWLTLFVEGVNDCLLDHCQVSSVPHYCAFKEQEIPRMYTVWMVIYWNSNVKILIFWDTGFVTFMSCKLYHQN